MTGHSCRLSLRSSHRASPGWSPMQPTGRPTVQGHTVAPRQGTRERMRNSKRVRARQRTLRLGNGTNGFLFTYPPMRGAKLIPVPFAITWKMTPESGWRPNRPVLGYAGGMRIRDDTGTELFAPFSVEIQPDGKTRMVCKRVLSLCGLHTSRPLPRWSRLYLVQSSIQPLHDTFPRSV